MEAASSSDGNLNILRLRSSVNKLITKVCRVARLATRDSRRFILPHPKLKQRKTKNVLSRKLSTKSHVEQRRKHKNRAASRPDKVMGKKTSLKRFKENSSLPFIRI